MAFMTGMARCFSCHQPFSFNPDLVPSIKGTPVCKNCIDYVNPIRISKGLAPIVPLPGAYEPQEVG